MHEIGPNLGSGFQGETSFDQPGMRHNKSLCINNFRTIKQKVDVDGPGSIEPFASGCKLREMFGASQLPFDLLNSIEQPFGSQRGPNGYGLIQEGGLTLAGRKGSPGCGLVLPRHGDQRSDRLPDTQPGGCKYSRPVTEVAAQKQHHLMRFHTYLASSLCSEVKSRSQFS